MARSSYEHCSEDDRLEIPIIVVPRRIDFHLRSRITGILSPLDHMAFIRHFENFQSNEISENKMLVLILRAMRIKVQNRKC